MSQPTKASEWFHGLGAMQAPRLRLFCLPHAAGSAANFRTWPAHFAPAGVEVVAIQLPGRAERWDDPAPWNVGELIPPLLDAISDTLDVPFAFLGHSMGALIAFELARALRRAGRLAPQALFVVACRAPTRPDPPPFVHAISDVEVTNELRRYGGTPDELLDDPELLEIFLPLIRADAAITETYVYTPDAPLGCAVITYQAAHDKIVQPDEVEAWRHETVGRFVVHVLPEDHFVSHATDGALVASLAVEVASLATG